MRISIGTISKQRYLQSRIFRKFSGFPKAISIVITGIIPEAIAWRIFLGIPELNQGPIGLEYLQWLLKPL